MFSIATNVSVADTRMIGHTLTSWLRVFDRRVEEVVVVADPCPLTGRIARLHAGRTGTPEELLEVLASLAAHDSRVRTVVLNGDGAMSASARKWFGVPDVVRCHDGTPVGAMVHAVECACAPLVLRTDCDMLFYEDGWLDEAWRMLSGGEADLLEPPRLGMRAGRIPGVVSTRALLLDPRRLAARLPLRSVRLDPLRRISRMLRGLPPWLPLETMLQRACVRGQLVHRILDEALGFSVHAYTREHALRDGFPGAIANIEAGRVPAGQPPGEWNLVLETT